MRPLFYRALVPSGPLPRGCNIDTYMHNIIIMAHSLHFGPL